MFKITNRIPDSKQRLVYVCTRTFEDVSITGHVASHLWWVQVSTQLCLDSRWLGRVTVSKFFDFFLASPTANCKQTSHNMLEVTTLYLCFGTCADTTPQMHMATHAKHMRRANASLLEQQWRDICEANARRIRRSPLIIEQTNSRATISRVAFGVNRPLVTIGSGSTVGWEGLRQNIWCKSRRVLTL